MGGHIRSPSNESLTGTKLNLTTFQKALKTSRAEQKHISLQLGELKGANTTGGRSLSRTRPFNKYYFETLTKDNTFSQSRYTKLFNSTHQLSPREATLAAPKSNFKEFWRKKIETQLDYNLTYIPSKPCSGAYCKFLQVEISKTHPSERYFDKEQLLAYRKYESAVKSFLVKTGGVHTAMAVFKQSN